MNKQEFMAMSLPYGLKARIKTENEYIHNVDHYMYQYICDSEKDKDLYKYDLILHPLSDLTNSDTKSIGFKVRLEVSNAYNNGDWILLLNGGFNLKTSPFYVIEILVKNHFDIAGLIEKGEAIDVNTLEVNPYK